MTSNTQIVTFLVVSCLALINGNVPDSKPKNPFNKLDGYTMLSVFDWLDLKDLMHMAEVHPSSQPLIAKYFLLPEYNVDTTEITITWSKDFTMLHATQEQFAHGSNQILFVLRTFGHLFRHLKINLYQNTPEPIEKLTEYINTYCSEAKQEIVIYSGLIQWNFTFNNATKVTKHWSMMRNAPNQATHWSNSFPQMDELVMLNAMSLAAINHHFPRLTRFTLRTNVDISKVDDLKSFLHLNRQLRHIEIPLPQKNDLLMYMKEMLPDLESLKLGKSNAPNIVTDDIVRFKNVRHFSWAVKAYGSSHGWDMQLANRFLTLEFDRLESFTLDTDHSWAAAEHIRLFVRNKALKSVEITKCELRRDDLMRIVHSLPALRTLRIGWEISGTLETLRQFLMNDTQLEVVDIRILDELQGNAEIISNYIPPMWQMIGEHLVDGDRILSFERVEN